MSGNCWLNEPVWSHIYVHTDWISLLTCQITGETIQEMELNYYWDPNINTKCQSKTGQVFLRSPFSWQNLLITYFMINTCVKKLFYMTTGHLSTPTTKGRINYLNFLTGNIHFKSNVLCTYCIRDKG